MPGLPADHVSKTDALQFDSSGPPREEPSEVSLYLQRAIGANPRFKHLWDTKDICPDRIQGFPAIHHKEITGRGILFDNLASSFVPSRHGSADSENDLAAMVHDFLENGSCGSDLLESSDNEHGLPSASKLLETLQALKHSVAPLEKELLTVLSRLCLSIKENDLVCCETTTTDCNGGCVRQLLVRHLRGCGYDAAVCSTKWLNSGKVPGGEYEYIDVSFEANNEASDRLIVDVDFQSQFAIARPTHSYIAAMKYLPVIFVGSSEKLEHVLQVMAEAAKLSLSQNSMPLPPWRTLTYMKAKWMSPYERIGSNTSSTNDLGNTQRLRRIRKKQCVEAVEDLKLCIAAEADKSLILKQSPSDRNRAMYLKKTRKLSTGLPYLEKLKALPPEKT